MRKSYQCRQGELLDLHHKTEIACNDFILESIMLEKHPDENNYSTQYLGYVFPATLHKVMSEVRLASYKYIHNLEL